MKSLIRHCSYFHRLLKVSFVILARTLLQGASHVHATQITSVSLSDAMEPTLTATIAEKVLSWLPMQHILQILIQANVSISFLIFLLIMPVMILALVFCRQVIGIHTGSIHYILLLTGMGVLVGWINTIVLFGSAWIGYHSVGLLSKKLYLLYASKTGTAIAVSCLVCLVAYAGGEVFSPGRASMLRTEPFMAFFPLITLSLMMPYVFPEKESVMSFQRRWLFAQFVFSVMLCTFLVDWFWLQQALLSFPDMIIAVIGSTILLGRYAGLQAAEYLRFWPLIQHYFKDEE